MRKTAYTADGQRPLSVGARWSYDQAPAGCPSRRGCTSRRSARRQPAVAPPRDAINPSLKVFVAAGLYDSLNSCAANDALVPASSRRFNQYVTAKCYEGGHMMYEEPRVRSVMTRDVAAFLRRP